MPPNPRPETPSVRRTLKLRGGRRIECGLSPRLMGVLNLTPDSFSDGGVHSSLKKALAQALTMLDEGADIVDVGGESTRPGAPEVPIDEEMARVVPAIAALRKERPDCAISVDTRKAEVAEAALEAGADIVNDISGLRNSPGMAHVAAQYGAGLALMHMRGTPATMQSPENLVYTDLVADIASSLKESVAMAVEAGVAPASIIIDPGLGFSKSAAQNLELMGRMDEFSSLGLPLLAGPSRKSFIGAVTGEADASMRDFGTAGAAAWLAFKGVDLIRVHNVRGVRHAINVFLACMEKSPKRG